MQEPNALALDCKWESIKSNVPRVSSIHRQFGDFGERGEGSLRNNKDLISSTCNGAGLYIGNVVGLLGFCFFSVINFACAFCVYLFLFFS